MKSGINVTTRGDVAVIELANPPVNAWSFEQRAAFVDIFV